MGTAQLVMPENYIALFNAPQPEQARQIVAKAEPELDRAIDAIRGGRPLTRPSNLYDRLMSGPMNPAFYSCFVSDRAFRVGEACTGCGSCAAAAPSTTSCSTTASRSGAGAARTAWPASATAPRRRSSTAGRAAASPRYHFEAL